MAIHQLLAPGGPTASGAMTPTMRKKSPAGFPSEHPLRKGRASTQMRQLTRPAAARATASPTATADS